MLDKKVFVDQMNELLVFFPSWSVKLDDPVIARKWFNTFESCTNQEFTRMVRAYIQKERFNPTVAGMKDYLVQDNKKSPEQIEWENLVKKQREMVSGGN